MEITMNLVEGIGFKRVVNSSRPMLWVLTWKGKQCGLAHLGSENDNDVRSVYLGLDDDGKNP